MTKLERIEAYDTWFKKFPFEGYRKEVTETIEPIITERINKFSDIKEMLEKGDLQFFFAQPVYQKENLIWKGKGDLVSVSKNLEGVLKIISLMSKSDFEIEKIKNAVWPFAESNGRGEVLWPLRYSLSGREKSPDPFTIASVLGKEETIKRLEFAVKLING
jgi:glutamyl/glutaminyl-tRNA synthetase